MRFWSEGEVELLVLFWSQTGFWYVRPMVVISRQFLAWVDKYPPCSSRDAILYQEFANTNAHPRCTTLYCHSISFSIPDAGCVILREAIVG